MPEWRHPLLDKIPDPADVAFIKAFTEVSIVAQLAKPDEALALMRRDLMRELREDVTFDFRGASVPAWLKVDILTKLTRLGMLCERAAVMLEVDGLKLDEPDPPPA